MVNKVDYNDKTETESSRPSNNKSKTGWHVRKFSLHAYVASPHTMNG